MKYSSKEEEKIASLKRKEAQRIAEQNEKISIDEIELTTDADDGDSESEE